MAGFPDIMYYFRHNGVFEIGKTSNFRVRVNVSKQKALLEKHQTGIRVENSLDQDQVRRFVRV